MIDIGMTPVFSLLIAILVFAIISDFLLELFSVRLSLSSGRIQSWLFDRFGQSLFSDFLFSIFFQFFSLRKKSFFLQFSSLINVGSFSSQQVILLALGSLIGFGFVIPFLLSGPWFLGASLCVLGLLLGCIMKDQIKDFALALFALGLFLVSLHLFSEYLQQSSLSIHQYHFTPFFGLVLIFISTVFFRTPVPFLLFMTIIHAFVGLQVVGLVSLLCFHSFLSLASFYWFSLVNRNRLRLIFFVTLSLQIFQFVFAFTFMSGFMGMVSQEILDFLGQGFLPSFYFILISYFIYQSLGLLLLSPLIFLITRLSLRADSDIKKKGSQKIIWHNRRGSCYSIHLSLFLLRQEFKKYVASVHTIFKIGRETDEDEEEINQKFSRYKGILVRVGDELKELCFNIGKQRSYRWQVKEVMSHYRRVNQLELLVEDLSGVAAILRNPQLSEDWEKDCRYWLGLQLKIFEAFFNRTVGVDDGDWTKTQANIEKSYEMLDRFFGDNQGPELAKSSSQTFYRVTESLASLARPI